MSQQANTWATGPSPGSFGATNPWNSAQWTVMVEIDGDGFREFAIHLDGSSGGPGTEIDTLAGIWSDRPDQSIDYENEPDIFRIDLNASAFIDRDTDQILNFQNSLTPATNWPNGASETSWDHGTTRATKIQSPGGCTEYLIDYQIPLTMLDASAVGGPTVDEYTPVSFIFATANSLQNPLQKDVVLNGDFISDPLSKIPFGDVVILSGGLVPQPLVASITVGGCSPTSLAASVRDACDLVGTTVVDADFYAYRDSDGNGSDDDSNSWFFVSQGTNTGISDWEATWDSSALPQGRYLIGVVATDAQGNVTYSFLNQAEVDALPGNPGNTTWYANTSPNPGVVMTPFSNICGTPPASLSKSVSPETTSIGGTVTYTITVSNPTDSAITLSQLSDTLPAGFSFDLDTGGSLTPTSSPSNGASGALTWEFSPAVSLPAASTATLIFDVITANVVGTYNNTASATTSVGTLTADPVAVGLGAARLSLSKTADAGSYSPGDTIVYTLTYANNSTVPIHDILLTDPLPDGLTFVSASDSGALIGSDVTWDLGDLAAGEGPFSVSFSATVDDPYPDAAAIPLANTATIDGSDADPVEATTSVFVDAPRPDLLLQKFANTITVLAGDSLTYTLAYLNRGNATATNVTLEDVIPVGFNYQSATPAPSIAPTVGTNGTVTWDIGSVAASDSGSVTLTVTATDPFVGTSPATNTATLDSDQTGPEAATHEVSVARPGSTCETFYFHDDTAVFGTVGTQPPPAPPRPTTALPQR